MTFEVTVTSSGQPVPFALVTANDEATGKVFQRGTDGNGYANVALFDVADGVPITLSVVAGGYQNAILYPTTTKDNQTIAVHLDALSFRKPLAELARLRGALWSARLNLPYGPRPGQEDNILAMDYFEVYSPADQDRMIAAYGPSSSRAYRHAPYGPIVDSGYHGQYPATDWRGNITPYFDAATKAERAGIGLVHFLIPDELQAEPVDVLDQQLTPLFSTPRAQALMQRVCLAWEPGGKYGFNNDWWVARCQWMARVFPKALRGVHLPPDQDAPTGQDDDKRGFTNAQCWANVAPYIHVFYVQNAGYTDSGNPVPSSQFITDFTNQFSPMASGSFVDRFGRGYAGWPTTSAWSALPPEQWPIIGGTPYQGILPMPTEYVDYADYWQNWPEVYAWQLGNAAMKAGAYGFLGGGAWQ